MTTFVWQLKVTQTTVAAAGLAVAAVFGSGYGVGALARRHADQVELVTAHDQRASAWQAIAQAHQEKAKMMGSIMEHIQPALQPLSNTSDLAANERSETDQADQP